MKKFLRIFGISLASLVGLALLTVCVVLWLLFTPARLTPIVNKQLPRFVTCQAHVERVELTFFSSFPRLGLRLDGVRLVNPTPGAPSDTLLQCGRVNAAIDIRAFLKQEELWLSDLELTDGAVCLFADREGRVNYDILKPTPDEEEPTDEGLTLKYISLDQLTLEQMNVRYLDQAAEMDAEVTGLAGAVKATFGANKATLGLALEQARVSFTYAGEAYLKENEVRLQLAADLATQTLTMNPFALHVDGLDLTLGGSVRSDLLRGIETDLWYTFSSWPVEKVLAFVPSSLQHYLDGIELSGAISSEGTIVGLYSDSSLPMVDARVLFEEGRVVYPAMLPYPLREVFADVEVHTNLEDADSYAKINSLRARTPRSSLRASGRVDRLFSDPRVDVTADVAASLADAKPFLPTELKLGAGGRVSGRVRALARLSQLENLAFDKMKLSGSLHVTDLDATYDTIRVATPSAKLTFSLPNTHPSTRHTSFVSLLLAADRLDASVSDATGAAATTLALDGVHLALETSNVLDEASTPAVVCDFALENLAADMDSLSLRVVRPAGQLSMEPGRRNAGAQRIKVRYGSDGIRGRMGDLDAVLEKLDVDASVLYDASREDLWEQLSPRGSISMSGAVAHTSELNYPVEMPVLAMDFTPRRFNVRQARVKLHESDFSLEGTVENIRPYFRGDSVLRAEFNFTSPVTNVTQLLALTSGIGTDEEEPEAQEAAPDEFTGPYMVPEGIDITFHANISKALWYSAQPDPHVFSNIRGDLRVADGKLYVSPEITFSSPATDGEVMLMYETPRKNHLFAGVSLHLRNIEIQELLGFVPDLDELMPMLRSFNGRGEFHLSGGGYMDSTYRFKLATLRGAGSVAATNLTLQDDELYDQIAFLLKKKDEPGVIRVDSLSAEFTVLRDKVDVYPFLLVMDRYKAVISGRHGLNMDYDYNISLVKSPLPFRAALDIKSRGEKLKFKLGKSKYPDFYRPERRGVVESQEMELRQMIRNALTTTSDAEPKE